MNDVLKYLVIVGYKFLALLVNAIIKVLDLRLELFVLVMKGVLELCYFSGDFVLDLLKLALDLLD